MYVVQVVQGANGRLIAGQQRPQPQQHRRTLSADATSQQAGGVIYVPPTADAKCQLPAVPPASALTPQPTAARTALMPWLGQFVQLVAAPDAAPRPRRPPPLARVHCMPPSASQRGSACTAAHAPTGLQDGSGGSDPLAIHLPGGDGQGHQGPFAFSSCRHSASAGIPATPTMVMDSASLAVRGPSALQANGSSSSSSSSGSSNALAASLAGSAPKGLQVRRTQANGAPALAPAAAPQPPGPLSFLTLQWPAGSTSSASSSGGGRGDDTSSMQWWGSPIGGTLFVNPPLLPAEPVEAAGAQDPPAALQAPPPSSLQRRPAAGAPAARSGSSSGSAQGPQAFLPALLPFGGGGGGGGSSMQWRGSLVGGTLFVNPQAPLEWHDSSSGGGTGGSSSSGGGGNRGAGAAGGACRQAGSGGAGAGGAPSPPSSPSFASGRVGAAAFPGVGLARAGVALMAALAAGALAVYAGSSSSSSGSTTTQPQRGPQPNVSSSGSDEGAARLASGPSGGGSGQEGRDENDYHAWMVARLSATLEGFESEQAMLCTELAMLHSMPGGGGGGSGAAGLWQGVRRLFAGDTTTGSSSSSSSSGAGAAGAAGAADVAGRVAEIREQLESISTLRSALAAELAEQQQLLRVAQAEQKVLQQREAVLAGR